MDDEDRSLLTEQIEYYRSRAWEYDESSIPLIGNLETQGQEVIAALDASRLTGHVLELACGTGQWTQELLRHADEVTALDSSQEMLELNKRKLNDARVRYIEANVFNWEPDRAYDAVVFGGWLSHVPPARFEAFWELVRSCLRRGGRVFFTDEIEDAWRGEEYLRTGGTPVVKRKLQDGTRYDVVKVFWDPGELEQRLKELGWTVTVRSTGAFYWGRGAPEQD